MSSERVSVSRLLAQAAADLDRRGLHYAGVVRRAARLLLDVPDEDPGGGCAGCGRPLRQPATGRRRKWCSEACRARARRR